MNIAILSSSRADYGIYLPLLKKIKADDELNMTLIAFGTHLSGFHGHTVDRIETDGFEVAEKVGTMLLGDSEETVASSMGLTLIKFASVWERLKPKIDLILALGDRYEMFAAVAASIPFNIPVAHLHGGETTLGAIDDKFRHAITQMSTYHFTSTKPYRQKVIALTGKKEQVWNIGALSLDNIQELKLLSKSSFKKAFNIDLRKPTILSTFHPETVRANQNQEFAQNVVSILEELSKEFQIVITMPNADTQGINVRKTLQQLINKSSNIIGVENFGTLGYFSCIKHSVLLIGNSSSGIIEAASFGKYVINIGDRQKGRAQSENTYDCGYEIKPAVNLAKQLIQKKRFKGRNIYQPTNKSAASQIIKILKNAIK